MSADDRATLPNSEQIENMSMYSECLLELAPNKSRAAHQVASKTLHQYNAIKHAIRAHKQQPLRLRTQPSQELSVSSPPAKVDVHVSIEVKEPKRKHACSRRRFLNVACSSVDISNIKINTIVARAKLRNIVSVSLSFQNAHVRGGDALTFTFTGFSFLLSLG